MTIKQITADVSTAVKVSERKVYRLMNKLNIKPLGQIAQRPQQFPEDSAQKIRKALGISETNGHAGTADDGKVVSLSKLKKARASARKAA